MLFPQETNAFQTVDNCLLLIWADKNKSDEFIYEKNISKYFGGSSS